MTSDEFYSQVILKEFVGRVTGEHRSQPIYFYLPNILHKLFPWSLCILAFVLIPRLRRAVKWDAATIWLACWILGSIVAMSLVPSKRFDRIFPIVPPMALFLISFLASAEFTWKPAITRRLVSFACVGGILFSFGYAALSAFVGYRDNLAGMVEFASEVRQSADLNDWEIAVRGSSTEAMTLYLGLDRFLGSKEVERRWKSGEIDALVIDDKRLAQHQETLSPFRVLLRAEPDLDNPQGYQLIVHTASNRVAVLNR